MAKFRVISVEERPDGQLALDIEVFKGSVISLEERIGHFTINIPAEKISAVSGATANDRVAEYEKIIASDPKIQNLVNASIARSKLESDIKFPFEGNI